MDKKERARLIRRVQKTGYAKVIGDVAMAVCAPVLFRTRRGVLRNGSMTLVLLNNRRAFGLTAGHVADKVLEHVGEKDICQVGGARLRPDWLVSRSKTLDLACFALDRTFMAASRHKAFRVGSLPSARVDERDMVILGGYPGRMRRELDTKLEAAFVWFLTVVQSVSEHRVCTVLNIKDSWTAEANGDRVRANANLGGCSGGPVFRVTEHRVDGTDDVDIQYELVGLVTAYQHSFQVMEAHTLTSLRSDGTFEE